MRVKYTLPFLFFLLTFTAQAQVTRYSYQREVTAQTLDKHGEVTSTLTRSSKIVFSDGADAKPIELDVIEVGKLSKHVDWKRFRDPQIVYKDGRPLIPSQPVNGSLEGDRMIRWAANDDGLYLPMESIFDDGRLRFKVRYFDHKIFHVELTVREVDGP